MCALLKPNQVVHHYGNHVSVLESEHLRQSIFQTLNYVVGSHSIVSSKSASKARMLENGVRRDDVSLPGHRFSFNLDLVSN